MEEEVGTGVGNDDDEEEEEEVGGSFRSWIRKPLLSNMVDSDWMIGGRGREVGLRGRARLGGRASDEGGGGGGLEEEGLWVK